MFLIDDLLMFPLKGFLFIAGKIHDMALEELEDTPEKLQRELFDLQMASEAGQITEKECQKRETDILKRMEVLKREEG